MRYSILGRLEESRTYDLIAYAQIYLPILTFRIWWMRFGLYLEGIGSKVLRKGCSKCTPFMVTATVIVVRGNQDESGGILRPSAGCCITCPITAKDAFQHLPCGSEWLYGCDLVRELQQIWRRSHALTIVANILDIYNSIREYLFAFAWSES